MFAYQSCDFTAAMQRHPFDMTASFKGCTDGDIFCDIAAYGTTNLISQFRK